MESSDNATPEPNDLAESDLEQSDLEAIGVESVAVYAAPDAVAAAIARQTLEAEGIPAVIGEQVTSAYGPTLAVGAGFWGEVHVPAAFADRAREILASMELSGSGISDEELTAAAEQSSDPRV